MDQGRAACLALVGDDEDECDVSCCHLARDQDPGDPLDVAMSYSNIQYTKRRLFSTKRRSRCEHACSATSTGRGRLLPEHRYSVPSPGKQSRGNRDVH